MTDNEKYFVEILQDIIKKYQSLKNYKIYISLGNYNKEFGFDEQLFSMENYNSILKTLASCDTWSDKNTTCENEYNEVPAKCVYTSVIRYKNTPYDIIVKVCSTKKEKIYVGEEFKNTINSYTKKNHTFITEYADSGWSEINLRFTLVIDKYIEDTGYLSLSTILKIKDVVSMCEPISANATFELVN